MCCSETKQPRRAAWRPCCVNNPTSDAGAAWGEGSRGRAASCMAATSSRRSWASLCHLKSPGAPPALARTWLPQSSERGSVNPLTEPSSRATGSQLREGRVLPLSSDRGLLTPRPRTPPGHLSTGGAAPAKRGVESAPVLVGGSAVHDQSRPWPPSSRVRNCPVRHRPEPQVGFPRLGDTGSTREPRRPAAGLPRVGSVGAVTQRDQQARGRGGRHGDFDERPDPSETWPPPS